MSVLIFIDSSEGHVKKASLEAMSYGAKIAEQLGRKPMKMVENHHNFAWKENGKVKT